MTVNIINLIYNRQNHLGTTCFASCSAEVFNEIMDGLIAQSYYESKLNISGQKYILYAMPMSDSQEITTGLTCINDNVYTSEDYIDSCVIFHNYTYTNNAWISQYNANIGEPTESSIGYRFSSGTTTYKTIFTIIDHHTIKLYAYNPLSSTLTYSGSGSPVLLIIFK